LTRLIVLVVVALVVVYLVDAGLKRLRRRVDQFRESMFGPGAGTGTGAETGRHPHRVGGRLVACRGCGVHVVESRALWLPGSGQDGASGPYCSEGCRRRARAAS
jgi:hypothetical protein